MPAVAAADRGRARMTGDLWGGIFTCGLSLAQAHQIRVFAAPAEALVCSVIL
jgi:hypothetical protein